MQIQLTDSTRGTTPYQDSVKNLTLRGQIDYISAKVEKGTWIMYKNVNFNDSIPLATEKDVMIVKPRSENYAISSHNGSMFLIPNNIDCLVLFQYVYYGGVNPDSHVSLLSSQHFVEKSYLLVAFC